jgi:type I restriction enzyme S subunit
MCIDFHEHEVIMAKKNSKKTVPELRFRGFTDPWEQRQLGEVAEFSKGQGYSKTDLCSSGIPAFLYGQMYTDYKLLVTESGKYLPQNSDGVFSTAGDVIIPASGESPEEIAIASVIGKTGILLGGDLNIIKPEKSILDSIFLALSASGGRLHGSLVSRAQGKTIVHLHNSDIAASQIRFPTLPEQRRIGEFFSAIDNLIAAAERQETILRQKKQAYLRLMFPKEGETEPRLRFAGFSGEWEQQTVGGLVGKTFGGGTPSTSNSEYWIGHVPWIQSSNVVDGQIFRVDIEKHISDTALRHSGAQLIPAGSIAVVTHVGVGKLVLVPFEYSTSQDFISLGDLKCDSRFLSLALQERLKKDLRVVQGSTIKGITKQDLLHKKLTLPRQRDEQARIATFLVLFEKTIAKTIERKTFLQRLKQAYLQKLFV